MLLKHGFCVVDEASKVDSYWILIFSAYTNEIRNAYEVIGYKKRKYKWLRV